MPWDRESNDEYDDGYTRESFERADEDDLSPDAATSANAHHHPQKND